MSKVFTKISEFADRVQLQHSSHSRGEFGYFNFGTQHGSGNNNKAGIFQTFPESRHSNPTQLPGQVQQHRLHQEAANSLLHFPHFQTLV
jgi:hypothetical protein